MHAGLARAVAVILERGGAQPVDRSDVDDTRWVLGARCGTQLAEQRDCEVEDALDVRVRDLVPPDLGELLQGRAPNDARVVDEDVQRREPLTRGSGECPGALRCGYVGGDRVAVPQRR